MKKLTLLRVLSDDQGSPGVLVSDGEKVCCMMEPPWINNETNISCIPKGTYQVKHLARSASGRYRDVYVVTGVAGRSGILIHPGNYAGKRPEYLSDSYGCLLPASRWGRLSGQRAGLASRGAIAKIHAVTGRAAFILEIR